MFSVKRAHFSRLAPLLVVAVAFGGVAIGSPATAAPILPAPDGDTAEVLRTESRLDAGVNLDGALFYGTAPSPIVTEGTTRPLLSVISSLHADSPEGRERFWDQYFRTPRGWSRVYAIADTGHASFTDAEHFVPQSVPDLPAFQIPGGLSLGTAPRQEVTRTIDGLVTAMFDRHLKDRQDPVLENPSPRYPLVREVR
ncbi:hypothetical protein ACGFIU_18410 [Rhodococcus oryzae]|uniref:hypothetical protein n=1 Tax=Rhodococcus oryzae TaxID=2571143 RepID=UPI003721564F